MPDFRDETQKVLEKTTTLLEDAADPKDITNMLSVNKMAGSLESAYRDLSKEIIRDEYDDSGPEVTALLKHQSKILHVMGAYEKAQKIDECVKKIHKADNKFAKAHAEFDRVYDTKEGKAENFNEYMDKLKNLNQEMKAAKSEKSALKREIKKIKQEIKGLNEIDNNLKDKLTTVAAGAKESTKAQEKELKEGEKAKPGHVTAGRYKKSLEAQEKELEKPKKPNWTIGEHRKLAKEKKEKLQAEEKEQGKKSDINLK